MRWSAGVGVLVGLVLAVSCSDRPVVEEEYPDAERLCALHCAQVFGPCYPNEPPAGSESDCRETCTDSSTWTGDCRWKEADAMECTTSLSCEEFRAYHTDPPMESSLCFETDVAFASCF